MKCEVCAEEIEASEGDRDFRLSSEDWDRALLDMFHGAHDVDSSKNLVEFTESNLPEFAKDRLSEAIYSDAVFSHFDSLADNDIMQLRNFLDEQLTDDRWNIDGLANRLQDLDTTLSNDEAKRIARTETQSIVAHAREDGYEDKGQGEDTFYWVGSVDDRTTDACKWLIGGTDTADNISGGFNGTNPNYGGEPVALDELRDLIQEAAEKDPDVTTDARKYTPHIQCRKTYVRDV
jgi:hypothetical protein